MKRTGYSLIEVIVVLLILSILIGLLLGAVQKVRSVASAVELKNQLRQLSLAMFTAESDRGKLPIDGNVHISTDHLADVLLPRFGYDIHDLRKTPAYYREFTSRSDPSYSAFPDNWEGNSSFSFNYLVFENNSTTRNLTDGLSNTVMASERYARCLDSKDHTNGQFGVDNSLHGGNWEVRDVPTGAVLPLRSSPRPITFLYRNSDDVLPIYDPVTRISRPSVPGLTFQVAPRPDACDPRILQSSTTSGLVVGMMDGSVRTLSPSIDPAVYWSIMTPDKGEVVSLE